MNIVSRVAGHPTKQAGEKAWQERKRKSWGSSRTSRRDWRRGERNCRRRGSTRPGSTPAWAMASGYLDAGIGAVGKGSDEAKNLQRIRSRIRLPADGTEATAVEPLPG